MPGGMPRISPTGEGFLGTPAGRDTEAEESTDVSGAAGTLNLSKETCRTGTGVEAVAGAKAEVVTTEDRSETEGNPQRRETRTSPVSLYWQARPLDHGRSPGPGNYCCTRKGLNLNLGSRRWWRTTVKTHREDHPRKLTSTR